MEYKKFNEETKVYINKVIEIYMALLNKDLNIKYLDFGKETIYRLNKLDKKVLALFMAGLIAPGSLKQIFSEYDDIRIEDLYEFANINALDIKPLSEEEYEEVYNNSFKSELIRMLKSGLYLVVINFVTPVVILKSIENGYNTNSEILNIYATKYGIKTGNLGWISGHPLFSALKNYALEDGSLVEKKHSDKRNNLEPDGNGSPSPLYSSTDVVQTFKLTDKIWKILDEIKEKFVGQEEAAEALFYNIINNQQLASLDNIPDGQRSIIFMDGPSGTGKTAITREITSKLGVPFVSTSVTNYSSTGYVGGDITDILRELYEKAGGDLELAQRGIVVLDEFDKIAYSANGGLEMKRAVQQQLLDFLGGGKYTIRVGSSIFDREEIEFDTSKLTFICLGALTNLRREKTERKTQLGFETSSAQEQEDAGDYSISPKDLESIGFEKELVGRFNTYLHTNDYSVESLERILRSSLISPLIGFKLWVEFQGKTLVIDDKVYRLIAEKAYELNYGARSLQTVINGIRTMLLKEVLRGTENTIYLNADIVLKSSSDMVSRRGRK